MIPSGKVLCTEISVDGRPFVILVIFENKQNDLSLYMTDSSECFTVRITSEQTHNVVKKMGISDYSVLYTLLKCTMQQKKIHYDKNTKCLTFSLSYCNMTEDLSCNLKSFDESQRQDLIKELFFLVVRELIGDKEPPLIQPSTTKQTSRISFTHTQHSPKKRSIGKSIVHPGSKRLSLGGGVKFDEETT